MIRKSISRLLNKTVQEFFNDKEVRYAVCRLSQECSNGSGGVTPNSVSPTAPEDPLVGGEYYTFTNTSPITVNLEDVDKSPGTRVGIINQGTSTVTVIGDMFMGGMTETELVLAQGETNILFNNSISWVTIA